MLEIKNVNLEKLLEKANEKLLVAKQSIKKGAFIVAFSLSTLSLTSCGDVEIESPIVTESPVPSEEPTATPVVTAEPTATPAPTAEPTATPTPTPAPTATPEVVITELNVEEFNKLVDKVEKANAEVGFNLKRENLELAVYINNMDLATPELIEKIESAYNYNEEDMMNGYLQTMTSYNNNKKDYYRGEVDKCADESIMFADKIDRDTIKYIDNLFNGLNTNVSDKSKIQLTIKVFETMVEDVMAKNTELGINLSRKEVEIAIYQRNSQYATEEVKKYIESIELEEGQTLDSIDNNTLNIYKAFNNASSEDFQLSALEYESYYISSVVEKIEGYMRNNDEIYGYNKDQLTVGGLFTAKLKVDDIFRYFITTGYANEYEEKITAIEEANFDACISRLYRALGSAAAKVECENEKVNTK